MYENMEEQENAIDDIIREISLHTVVKQCENIKQCLTPDQKEILERIEYMIHIRRSKSNEYCASK